MHDFSEKCVTKMMLCMILKNAVQRKWSYAWF